MTLPIDDLLLELLGLDEGEEDWRKQALCAQVDPEIFFPGKGGSTREAKSVCMACPVRQECLDWAVRTGQPDGVWGGMSVRERREYAQAHRIVAKPLYSGFDDELDDTLPRS